MGTQWPVPTSSLIFFIFLIDSVVTVAKPPLGSLGSPIASLTQNCLMQFSVRTRTGSLQHSTHTVHWLLPLWMSFRNLNCMTFPFLFLKATGVFTCPETLTGIDSSQESFYVFQGWLVVVIKAQTAKMLVSISEAKSMGIWLKRPNVLVSCKVPGEQGTPGISLKIFLWGVAFPLHFPLKF